MKDTMDDGSGSGPDLGCLRAAGYELVGRLGGGGMGEVWAAARLGLEGAIKPCAIKLIRPAFAHDEGYRRLFVAEGRVAMMLSHANIVSVFDVGVVDQLLFMAMELVDGIDLSSFRQQVQQSAGGRPLAIDDAVHVVGALLDALGYAHDFSIAGREHGIVHRDVSPGNVMITSRGEVKLMDFGLAGIETLGGIDGVLREGPNPRFRGTLRYLSREQARGRPEAASDLYAVGAILHELLEGRRFRYWCRSDEELLTEILEGGIPPLGRRVPGPVEALRRGLLEPRAELRIKTARRALTLLATWAGYRNRRLFLESLYRQVIGEPRSGITQLLALGVHGELLEALRRRVEAGRVTVAKTWPEPETVWVPREVDDGLASREAQRTVPMRAATGVAAADAVVRARAPERASAHRVAVSTGEPAAGEEDGIGTAERIERIEEDPVEREITEPWPGRSTSVPSASDPSVAPWSGPSSAVVGDAWAASPARLAGLMVLAALLGGLSTLVVVGVAWGSEGAPPLPSGTTGGRPGG